MKSKILSLLTMVFMLSCFAFGSNNYAEGLIRI